MQTSKQDLWLVHENSEILLRRLYFYLLADWQHCEKSHEYTRCGHSQKEQLTMNRIQVHCMAEYMTETRLIMKTVAD